MHHEKMQKNFEIKVTLTDCKTGKELDYFMGWESSENYARKYFLHVRKSFHTGRYWEEN